MPDEEPEESFTFRDRRRFTGEPTPTAEPAPAAESPSTVTAAAAASPADLDDDTFDGGEQGGGGMFGPGEDETGALPDIYSVLALFLGELRNLAWLRMGLVANPATGQIERDLDQAKIAIDTVAFLAGQLESVVAPEEKLPLKALVSDLQINFVEQSKRGGGSGIGGA